MIHDHVASVCNLARSMRQSVDLTQDTVSVNAHSLALILDTLVQLGLPNAQSNVRETAQSMTVIDHIKAFSGG